MSSIIIFFIGIPDVMVLGAIIESVWWSVQKNPRLGNVCSWKEIQSHRLFLLLVTQQGLSVTALKHYEDYCCIIALPGANILNAASSKMGTHGR